jgi:hypothetical protein
MIVVSLYRKNTIAMAYLPCHEQAQLPHPLGALAGLWLSLRNLPFSSTITIYLIKLLFAALPLLLQALDNVDGSA